MVSEKICYSKLPIEGNKNKTFFRNIEGCHIITYSKKIRYLSVKKNEEFQIIFAIEAC